MLSVELADLKEVYLGRRPQLLNFRRLHQLTCNPAGDFAAGQDLWRHFNPRGAPGKISDRRKRAQTY